MVKRNYEYKTIDGTYIAEKYQTNDVMYRMLFKKNGRFKELGELLIHENRIDVVIRNVDQVQGGVLMAIHQLTKLIANDRKKI